MLNSLIKEPGFDKTPLGKRARFWYFRLFEKLASLFEYEGLPASINRDYLETVLLNEGSVVWIKDKQGNLRALHGAHYGFDCYNFPTTAEIANPILGTLKGTFGVNAVWMRNNIYAAPVHELVREYAYNLAQLDVDFLVNLDNLKTTRVFHASNSSQAKQVKELYKKIIAGEPAVVSDGDAVNFFSEDKLELFSSGVDYIGDKLLSDRRTLINDFLTQFGINNIALEKKERLITGEVDTNNQELEINKNYWLKPRQEALEEVNRIFGTNITVDITGKEMGENVAQASEGLSEPV